MDLLLRHGVDEIIVCRKNGRMEKELASKGIVAKTTDEVF